MPTICITYALAQISSVWVMSSVTAAAASKFEVTFELEGKKGSLLLLPSLSSGVINPETLSRWKMLYICTELCELGGGIKGHKWLICPHYAAEGEGDSISWLLLFLIPWYKEREQKEKLLCMDRMRSKRSSSNDCDKKSETFFNPSNYFFTAKRKR